MVANNLVLRADVVNLTGVNHRYFVASIYHAYFDELSFVPYDLTVFPIVDGKFVIDLRLPVVIPYDAIILPRGTSTFVLTDELGRVITLTSNDVLTIDSIESPCSVTDNYIILMDYDYFRIVKRSYLPNCVVTSSVASVDLAPVLTAISLAKAEILSSVLAVDNTPVLTAITSAKTEILNFVPTIDLTPIDSSLTTIKTYTDTLEAELLSVKDNVGALAVSLDDVLRESLNGNGCEFMDGKEVTVEGRNTIYSVVRSYMGLVTDTSYTVFYDLSATTGEKLTVPESLLTLYTAPIVIP